MKLITRQLLIILISLITSVNVAATSDQRILITNVNVFNGKDNELGLNRNIFIEGNIIKAVDVQVVDNAGAYDLVIDGRAGTLMPGLIDTHTHLSFVGPLDKLVDWSWDYIGVLMNERAEATLMRGFTTIRDMGGQVMGLKQAIDQGLISGPRIYPSGAFLTQTGGHADLRDWTDLNPRWSSHSTNLERLGFYRTTDGVADVLAATRENLAHGATQIKIMASGGMGSHFDPLDSIQFTAGEMQAAVEAAENWDTYVSAHVQNGRAIFETLKAGIMSIEHGNGIDEKGMKLLVKKGAFLNTHFASPRIALEHTKQNDYLKSKAQEVIDQTGEMIRLIRKYNPKLTYCTDAAGAAWIWEKKHSAELLDRAKIFAAPDILRQATSAAAELLALSNNRNPYPGKLGVIEQAALADLIIVKGNILEDVSVLAKPENNILFIMKDGVIYKNIL